MSVSPSWSIAVFSSRESVSVLQQTVDAVIRACGAQTACIDVLVNGNAALADNMADYIGRLVQPDTIAIRVWHLAVADKACAWNSYVYSLWPQSDIAFFIDGYVRVKSDALGLLADGLQSSPALAATGVPSVGRSATQLKTQMLAEGGIHGNLFALPARTMRKLQAIQFRLPLGIYRTDSTIGAVINFNFDPSSNEWDARRILVHGDVTWDKDTQSWCSIKNLSSQTKRMLRQAQGVLENTAIKNHLAINKLAPGSLPETVAELVRSWVATHKEQARRLFFKNPLTYLAWRKLRETAVQSGPVAQPVLVFCSATASE